MVPRTVPESRAVSAVTPPTISPLSPWTNEVQVTSPSTCPSICRSAEATTLPLMRMSAPNTENVELAMALTCCALGADRAGFLENIGGCLKEGAGIDRAVVDADLEMELRPGR